MNVFETGHSLSRGFYWEVLAPSIGLPHSAGLLGSGSDVLGYDTERSTDHDWGPRSVIFVEESQVDYAPYVKWLGTAFARLDDDDELGRHLGAALATRDLRTREDHLGAAFQALANRFNALSPEVWVDPTLRTFHDRPAVVLRADRFAAAALAQVEAAALRELPLIGSVDQVADSTDLLSSPSLCRELRGLYERP